MAHKKGVGSSKNGRESQSNSLVDDTVSCKVCKEDRRYVSVVPATEA